MWEKLENYHADLGGPEYRLAPGWKGDWRRFTRGHIGHRDRLCLVAELDQAAVGFLLGAILARPRVFEHRSYGHIYDLFVDPARRNRGVGESLVREALAWFRSRRVEKVDQYTHARNEMSLGVWKKMGFETTVHILDRRIRPPARLSSPRDKATLNKVNASSEASSRPVALRRRFHELRYDPRDPSRTDRGHRLESPGQAQRDVDDVEGRGGPRAPRPRRGRAHADDRPHGLRGQGLHRGGRHPRVPGSHGDGAVENVRARDPVRRDRANREADPRDDQRLLLRWRP